MKKILLYSLLFISGLLFYACEDDLKPYHEKTDRLNFVFEDYMVDTIVNYSFVYYQESRQKDTVWLEVETMGYVVDYDRKIPFKQIATEGTQAVAGTHYVAFDDPEVAGWYVISAGKNKVRVPVVVKRDPSLKNETVTLKIGFAENEYFSLGYSDLGTKVITISDFPTQPEHWNFYANYYFAGKYGKVKHQFMIDATASMGLLMDDDFFKKLVGNPNGVDMGLTDYWFGFFTKKLKEANALRASQGLLPFREAPEEGEAEGKLVEFTQYQM
ncbi:MAG: DUF4843 domain-containing protein [Odoribacter sp.]